jgi:hypothetical protein
MHNHKEILKVVLVVVVVLILIVLVVFGIRRWVLTDNTRTALLAKKGTVKGAYGSAQAARQARWAAGQNYLNPATPPPPTGDDTSA